jgi:hypothetical protein
MAHRPSRATPGLFLWPACNISTHQRTSAAIAPVIRSLLSPAAVTNTIALLLIDALLSPPSPTPSPPPTPKTFRCC